MGRNEQKDKPTKEKFDIRYELLRNTLDKENIQYDSELKTYEELREHLRKTLPIQKQIELDRKLRTSQDEMLTFANDLKIDTNTGAQNVLARMGSAFEKVKDKAAFATLATATGVSVAQLWKLLYMPAAKSAWVIAGGLTVATGVPAIYFGSKMILNHRRKVKGELYDEIIKKLEITKDKDGNIKDTRFDEIEKEEIKKYFESIGKELDISDYDKIRTNIKALKNPQKLELIKKLNEAKGLPLDLDKELAKNKVKRIQNIKDTFKAIGTGYITGTLFVLPIVQMINKVIPLDALDFIASLGLNLTFGVGGVALGLANMIRKKVIANIEEKKQANIEKRREEAADKKLYPKKGESDELSRNQLLMLDIVKRYLEEKGITLEDNVQNVSGLKKIVGELSKEDKKELNRILTLMKKQLEEANFEGKAKKVLKHTNYSTAITPICSTIHNVFEENVRTDSDGRCME